MRGEASPDRTAAALRAVRCEQMRRLTGIMSSASAVLAIIWAYVSYSCYKLFVEGTVDDQSRITHEPSLKISAERYAIAACVFAILTVIHWALKRWELSGDNRTLN